MLRLLGLGSAGLVASCCVTAPSIEGSRGGLTAGLLAEDPAAMFTPDSLVAIDAHAHFFNASDLQVAGYLAGPVANEASPAIRRLLEILHPVVEQMARSFAPSTFSEWQYLEALEADVGGLSRENRLKRLDASIIERKNQIADELYRRLKATNFPEVFEVEMRQGNYLIQGQGGFSRDALRASLDYGFEEANLFNATATFSGPDEDHPAGLLAFIGNMFHYRIQNVRIYQKAFTSPSRSVKVVAACHALVDFDYWLPGCKHPPSRLREQVLLTEKLVKATNGYIIPLVAYNPWSDLANKGASLALVREAITNRGFAGVKLYPPICYQPLGSGEEPLKDGWPSPNELRPRLEALYQTCLELDVPVMAHANFSMGAEAECKSQTSPENWFALVRNPRFTRLRINAGHFGGNHDGDSPARLWSREFVDVMSEAPHFYADIGNWVELARGDVEVRDKLVRLMQVQIGPAEFAAQRIAFGSDWFMLAKKKIWPVYADRVHQNLKTAGATGEEMQDVLQHNAIRLFGLSSATPGRNRQRLLDYYTRNDLNPEWLSLT